MSKREILLAMWEAKVRDHEERSRQEAEEQEEAWEDYCEDSRRWELE